MDVIKSGVRCLFAVV